VADDLDRISRALSGRYTVERELGRGGTATVYLARDPKHDRPVAIKVLRPELAAALGTERFIREIEIAAKLTHPHILPLFDSGETDGLLYYVMPYVEGESLRDRLEREGRVPVAEAIRLTDQIASALAYAHERGVVHRDIKPENILLTGDQAVVADFGIARAVEAAGGHRLTGTGLAIGTPAYMSPEQAFGTHEVDARTDVYGLGCVVFEMVAGRAPFEAPTAQALFARHAAGAVPRLRGTDPDIPLFVERAVERALAKDPSDRFATPTELAAALTGGVVVARVRRRRMGRWAVATSATAAVLAAGLGLASTLGAARIERLAVLPLVDMNGDPDREYLLEGVHEALISELARTGLSVIARTTMRQYHGTDKSIRAIADELGVHAIIEGAVHRRGDTLEISARLYDAAEREIWSGSYDGDLPNAVALYRGFARAIADQIRLKLSPAAAAHLAASRPLNPDVYEAYLKGMYILSRARPRDDLSEALGYFERAIEANPADPLAYVGLADAYVTLGHGPDPPPDVWVKARAAAERAMRLDSTIAEAWSSMAQVKYYYEWDWEGADRAFRRANELNPSLPMNRYHYAWYLVTVGREREALAEHHRARELDPLRPLHTVWIPGLYMAMGDHARAIAEARKHTEEYPDHPIPYFVLGSSLAEVGRFDEAIAAHETMVSVNQRWIHPLGVTYALAGRRDDALRILADLESRPPSPWLALGLAQIHAALGHREEALRWLEYEPRHGWWAGYLDLPVYEFLHDEPRFQEWVRMVARPRTGRG
jgi:eukaryotic-like serine/threonine-protein kinase